MRIYAKQKAISVLQFYQTDASETYLIGKVQDSSLHPSLRNFAVKSYAEGFCKRNPTKVEALLGSFENDGRIGKVVQRCLHEARTKAPGHEPKRFNDDLHLKQGNSKFNQKR